MSRQFSYRQQSERMRLPPPVLQRSVGHFGYRFESTGQPCWRGCWPSPGTGSADTLAHQWRSRTWGEEVEISSRTVGMTAAKITGTKVSAMSYKHKLQLLELQTASEFKTLLHFKAFLPWSWSSISALGSKSAGSQTLVLRANIWCQQMSMNRRKPRWWHVQVSGWL